MPFPGMALIRSQFRRERERFRHFMGRDLPPRTLELCFDHLPVQRRDTRPPLTEARQEQALAPHRATPMEYGTALLAETRRLNRWPLGEKKRVALLEAMTRRVAIELLPQLAELSREGSGIPESANRAQQMDLAGRLLDALTDGYRLIFAADYARSPFWYARARARVHLCAGRLLELIKLKHRLLGLRYAPLPGASWRLANTVFAVMRACEATDLPQPTLAALGGIRDLPWETTLERLYASIQTYRLLDYSAGPEAGQAYIDTYCSAVDQGIRIHPYDGHSPLGVHDLLLAACYQDSPPARELPRGRTPEELGPSVIIDYRILAQTIRYDFSELSRARAERNRMAMPPRLGALEPVYQTAVGYLLARNLRPPELWEGVGNNREGHRDLRVYVGLQEVRSHLLTIFSADDRLLSTRELSNIFSRRSAMIGADDSATRESLWYVLFEDDQRLRIQTQETQFTHRMFIGNLLAYGFGHTGAFAPRIGKVNRIYRPEPGMVLIDIDYLARYATPVLLQPWDAPAGGDAGAAGASPDAPDALRAVLIEHPQRGWGLLTPPQDAFWEHTPVLIRRGQRVTADTLGEAQDVTAEFCWFSLSGAPWPNLKPAYPRAAAERAAAVADLPATA